MPEELAKEGSEVAKVQPKKPKRMALRRHRVGRDEAAQSAFISQRGDDNQQTLI